MHSIALISLFLFDYKVFLFQIVIFNTKTDEENQTNWLI